MSAFPLGDAESSSVHLEAHVQHRAWLVSKIRVTGPEPLHSLTGRGARAATRSVSNYYHLLKAALQ